MEILNGIVDSIVFKSDDTGYVVSKIRTEKDSSCWNCSILKRRSKC